MSDVVVAHKSTIRRWIEKIADETGNKVVKSHAAELAFTIRQLGEGGVVGAILGAVDSEVGLDYKGVPLDLVAAAAGAGAAMYTATDENGISHDLRNVGSHSFSIFTFRKTKELMQKIKIAGEGEESTTSDVGEEDPVVQAARDL